MDLLSEGVEAATQVDWGAVLSNPILQVVLVVVAGMVIYRIVSLGVTFILILLGGILAILFLKYVLPWSAIVAICAAVIEYVLQPFYLGRSWECSVKGVLWATVRLGILAIQNAFILAMLVYFFRSKEREIIKAAVILAVALTVGLFFAGCFL